MCDIRIRFLALAVALLAAGSACNRQVDLGRNTKAVCTPGQDQTCNDNPAVSTLKGKCLADSTCLCISGFSVDPTTGLCTASVHDGGAAVGCTLGQDQTCNDDPAVSALWGKCLANGTCSCTSPFTVNPATGRCSVCTALGEADCKANSLCAPNYCSLCGCTPAPFVSCRDKTAAEPQCLQAPCALNACNQPYLLWQGAFSSGVGAALELLSDGTVNLWAGTAALAPHKTSSPSTVIKLSPDQLNTLSALLSKVTYINLPHSGSGQDCQDSFYFEPCPSCAPVSISYKNANELRPEVADVYLWLEQNLMTQILLPGGYC